MSDRHDHGDEMSLFALGLLSAEEAAEWERRLEEDPSALRELHEAEALFREISLTAPPKQPPAVLRDRLMQRIDEETDLSWDASEPVESSLEPQPAIADSVGRVAEPEEQPVPQESANADSDLRSIQSANADSGFDAEQSVNADSELSEEPASAEIAEEAGIPIPVIIRNTRETRAEAPIAVAPHLERAGDADWAATDFPGVSLRTLHVDAAARRETVLVKMEAGAVYPTHTHGGTEECYVIRGDLIDGGVRMGSGDYSRYDGGSEHGPLSTREGCLLLVIHSMQDEVRAGL